jgi:hypothetical protein
MTPQELQKKIEFLRVRLAAGQNPEEDKLEIKAKWYSLKDPDKTTKLRAQSEFLKDIVAIANTPGLSGLLIIGISKDGNLQDSPFAKSGLRDQTDLRGLIIKNVDEPVDFQLHEIPIPPNSEIISVIEIPISGARPHVIGRYVTPSGQEIQNFIPIRKATGVYAVNRHDLDLIYLEKSATGPEYSLEIASPKPKVIANNTTSGLALEFPLVFHNTGTKPIAIAEGEVHVLADDSFPLKGPFKLKIESYRGEITKGHTRILSEQFLKIEPGELQPYSIFCLARLASEVAIPIRDHKSFRFLVNVMDTNGRRYESPILQRSR